MTATNTLNETGGSVAQAPATAIFPPLSRRMTAYFIDLAIVAVVAIATLTLLLYATSGSAFASALASLGQGAGGMLIFMTLTNIVYHVFMECHVRYRGTVGKILMGLEVVDREGLSLTVGRALLRAFARLLPIVSCGLLYLVALRGGQFRSLHDRLAGTVVVIRARGCVNFTEALQTHRKMSLLDWVCTVAALTLFVTAALPFAARMVVRLLGAA